MFWLLEHSWDSRLLPFWPDRIHSSFIENDSYSSCFPWQMSFFPSLFLQLKSSPLSTSEKAIIVCFICILYLYVYAYIFIYINTIYATYHFVGFSFWDVPMLLYAHQIPSFCLLHNIRWNPLYPTYGIHFSSGDNPSLPTCCPLQTMLQIGIQIHISCACKKFFEAICTPKC